MVSTLLILLDRLQPLFRMCVWCTGNNRHFLWGHQIPGKVSNDPIDLCLPSSQNACEGGTHFNICVWNYYCNFVYWVYRKMYKFVGMAERNMAVIVTVVEIKSTICLHSEYTGHKSRFTTSLFVTTMTCQQLPKIQKKKRKGTINIVLQSKLNKRVLNLIRPILRWTFEWEFDLMKKLMTQRAHLNK